MDQSYEAMTHGGAGGHWLRRAIHVLLIGSSPIIFYYAGPWISSLLHVSMETIVIAIVALILVLEVIRLALKKTAFGQRAHEAHSISSFAWAAFATGLVLLLAPGKEFGIPIIWCAAFVDPMLGEMRRSSLSNVYAAVAGVIVCLAIWFIASKWLGVEAWWGVILAPITVAVEWPNIRHVDDNALMQLIPLTIVLVATSLFHF